MTSGGVVVVGIGNEFRRDDGAGLAVVDGLAGLLPPEVRLERSTGEPHSLIEAWTGAELAVVVDAVRATPPTPGRVHHLAPDDVRSAADGSGTHGLGLGAALDLAAALDRLPRRVAVVAVEAGDTGHGLGLTDAVACAIPALIDAVIDLVAASPETPPLTAETPLPDRQTPLPRPPDSPSHPHLPQ